MNIPLTGQKDADLFTLNKLDDKDLISFCIISKEANQFCSKYDSELWMNRFIKKYGEDATQYKSPEKSWKQFYLQILKYWKPAKDYYFSINSAMMDAAQDGHEDLVNFFISKGADVWNWGLQGAAIGGHKDLVDFFISKGGRLYFGLEGAGEGGHLDLINFLISKGAKGWDNGLQGAAKGGHKDLVDFFISKGARDWSQGLSGAAEGGHLDLVKFFVSKGAADTLDDLEHAIRLADNEEHFDVADYLDTLLDEKYPDRFN